MQKRIKNLSKVATQETVTKTMQKRQPFYVKTRYETLKVCTTCEKVALQLAEIVMGKSHEPFLIVNEWSEPIGEYDYLLAP